MAEDIYPLGQGQGLMTDALNFALNNLYQYGQRTAESNKRTGEIFEGIRSGQRPDLSPLLQDAASINPVGGMIKPATWNAMQPEMKAALNVFGDRYPSTFGAVLASRPNLTGQVTKDLPSGATATLRNVTPEEQLMKVRPFYAESTPTIGHELQHALNVERVAKTHPLDALTIATLLKEQLPASNRGSLDTILSQVLAKEPMASKIGRKFSGAPEPPLQVQPGTSRGLMRVAMDEALAYLGQNAAQGPKRTGDLDPMVQKLAERLGVKWGGVPYKPPAAGAAGPLLKSSIKPGSTYQYQGKPFAMGVADPRDAFIEQIADLPTVKGADFHHNMWVKPQLLERIKDDLAKVFWMEHGRPVTMEGQFAPEIAAKISQLVKKGGGK